MRFYKNTKGQFVPSGTTVLGGPPVDIMMAWSANCAVDYIETEILDIISRDSYLVEDAIYELAPKARTAYQRESMEAADYGTYIHTMCQYSLENRIMVESPHELTNLFSEGLWRWIDKHNVKVIAMEHEVVTDLYGGRLDLVCEMDSFWMTKAWCKRYGVDWYKGINKQRVIVLVDFKTGKGTYYDTWKYQLAGYRQAWNYACVPEHHRNTGNAFIDKTIQSHGILKFNKETGKVNYKCFDEYQATRKCLDKPRKPNGKLQTEKYTRIGDVDDRKHFNNLVDVWWSENQ